MTVTVYTVVPPGVAVSVPSVLVIDRSASATTVVLSVAELLAGVGSTPTPGIATVAVFDSNPMNPGAIVASTTKVAVAAGEQVDGRGDVAGARRIVADGERRWSCTSTTPPRGRPA